MQFHPQSSSQLSLRLMSCLLLLLLGGGGGGSEAAPMVTASGGLTVIDAAATTTTTLLGSRQPLSTTSTSTSTGTTLRKRHRKRNSSWYDYRNYNENTTAVEWLNPCGGYYIPNSGGRSSSRRKSPKQIFNLLKRAAGNEYRSLHSSQEGIDISDIQMWSLHNYNYKFLPKLKPNSTIALKRWYRNMQTYVASFAYLRRVQINWDRQHLKRESRAARELKHLLLSSRSMLCELETAVNHTYPAPGASQRRQLPQISRNDMNKRLKLRSKRRPSSSSSSAGSSNSNSGSAASAILSAAAAYEADSIDLQFVKHHYYEFLRTMWQLLRQNTKRLVDTSTTTTISANSQQQQRQQQRQRQRQRQQQQLAQRQQLAAFRLQLAANRKEFNEVAKPTAELAGGRRGKRQQPSAAASRRVLRT